MVNFGPLTAEIGSGVWGTTEGANYIWQGDHDPHSSFICCRICCTTNSTANLQHLDTLRWCTTNP